MLLVTACGDEEDEKPETATLSGTTACERYESLAEIEGCSLPGTCYIDPACEPQTRAWVDCLATDLAQCSCEADGDLNCEGSYKPNEGPARCVPEHDAMAACESE